jgi:glutamyl endopeptidase
MKTNHWAARVAALAILATLSRTAPVAAANLTPEESETMTAPLAPNDPRAQTDPAQMELPEMRAELALSRKRISRRAARQVVEHDLQSGRTTMVKNHRRGNQPPGGGQEYSGSAAQGPGSSESDQALGATRAESSAEVVWGTDDRVRITATTSYPWRAHTKLNVTFPNGKSYMCSGSLIAAKYVITAGHCTHSGGDGGWATRVEVIPGYDNGYRPFGTAYATRIRSDNGWTTYRLPEYDFAVLTLDRSIGNSTGWLGYAAPSITDLYSYAANISGYPADKCGGACQYYDFDPISWVLATTIYYNTDTFGGHSGSSVYSFINGGRYVVAVHRGTCSGRLDKNCGVRLTGDRTSRIAGWINSGS